MILALRDGAIEEITSDASYYAGGCDTCDYGAEYVNEYEFTLTTGRIKMEAKNEDFNPLTEGYMMKILLPNVGLIQMMSEQEFYEWLKNETSKYVSSIQWLAQ